VSNDVLKQGLYLGNTSLLYRSTPSMAHPNACVPSVRKENMVARLLLDGLAVIVGGLLIVFLYKGLVSKSGDHNFKRELSE
jgi:hypothetical protein